MDSIDVKPFTISRRHATALAVSAVRAIGAVIATLWPARPAPAVSAAPIPAATPQSVSIATAKAGPRATQVQFEPNRGQP